MTSTPAVGDPLTARELGILQHVAVGASNAMIGRRLSLSEDTVKTHLRHAYRKLGVGDRAHAVAIAYQRGLLAMPWGSEPRIEPRPVPPPPQPGPVPGSIAAKVHAARNAPIRKTPTTPEPRT